MVITNSWENLATTYETQNGSDGITRNTDLCKECIIYPGLVDIINVSLDPNSTILDAGCGNGRWLEIIESEGYRTVALDLSYSLLKSSRNRSSAPHIQANLEDPLPFLSNSMEAITNIMVLSTVANIQKFAQETTRILKPSGRIFLVIPNPNAIMNFRRVSGIDIAKIHQVQQGRFEWTAGEFTDFFLRPISFYKELFERYDSIQVRIDFPQITQGAKDVLEYRRQEGLIEDVEQEFAQMQTNPSFAILTFQKK